MVTQCIRKSRSLKFGSRAAPSKGYTTAPASTMAPTAIKAGRGVRMIRASSVSYFRCSHRTRGDSRRSIAALPKSMRASAGVTVRAITIEASTASA